MKAIIIGATGATGSELLKLALNNETLTEITAWGTRKLEVKSAKLKSEIINFDNLADFSSQISADIAYSCIGTTLKKAGSKAAQWTIDYDYQLNFAKACAKQKVNTFVLVSSLGADSNSSLFYNRMKGQLEEAIKNLPFKTIIIFRPSLLIRPNTNRKGEIISAHLLNFLNKLGLLKMYKPITTQQLAMAMLNESLKNKPGVYTYSGVEIFNL